MALKAGGAKAMVFVTALGDRHADPENHPLVDLMSRFADEEVAFAIVTVMGAHPKGAVVSRRTKGILFTWIGEHATWLVKICNVARGCP